MIDIKKLARKNILELSPYSCARDEYTGSIGIFLDANENSMGSVLEPGMNRYPDPRQSKLKSKIGKIKKIEPEQIFLGNGSDEVIDILIRAFCEPRQDKIMIFPPTYGMYKVAANVNDVGIVEIPLSVDFQINTESVLKNLQDVKLLFICSPNNPSGNCLRENDIEKILANFNGIVIIDEAYIDFANRRSWLPRLDEFQNMVIMQTFSKAWGLAGIRLGMCFADPRIIDLLTKIKYPYNVNGVTQQIALEALANENKKDEMVKQILSERSRLVDQLRKLDIVEKIFPSEANFLLVKFADSERLFNYLISGKIIVRNRSRMIQCENCLRITVGTPTENDELIQKLQLYKGNR